MKDDEGQWDRRPHRDRIQHVEESVLKTWKSVLENDDTPWLDTRMVYTVNTDAAAVLEKLAAAPRMKDLDLQFSRGWDESIDKKKGYFDVGWGHPDSWDDVILQGPHLGVSTPMIKQPNPTMTSNKDWIEIDLEALPADFIPATAYQPNHEMPYNEEYAKWMDLNGDWISARKFYRVAWRQMAATTGFRTMYPALIPPGTTHVNGVITAGMASSLQDQTSMLAAGAFLSSLLSDFVIRSAGTHLWPSLIEKTPVIMDSRLTRIATISYLRLNCLTSAYAPLWKAITDEDWTFNTPIRNAKKRFHAQNEIDAAVALSLNISVDELCTIYRTQFPVMRRYDQENLFDANGRRVAPEIMKLEKKLREGEELPEEKRTWTHPQSQVSYYFEYPFTPLDREKDLRAAYARHADGIEK
ncbi:hypothetical protein HMPREF0290_2783 [Corynebacterium efficiens YS-314]|nr:hypothetical protein HMPREF0290_2783 [Corynebacterium efficiens YS-314]